MPETISDLGVMAQTIWGEARGDFDAGMFAVAHVIMNRAKAARKWKLDHPKRNHVLFGSGTVTSACWVPFQFSCWNKGDPNLPKLSTLNFDDKAFRQCVKAALAVIEGGVDPTHGSLHYYAKYMKKPPAWALRKKHVYETQGHLFFNNID